jgi:tetratricopeptide (TPR) repeat protein/Zn-dependent protease
MQYLLYAIAFYLLLLALPYIIAFLQFRKVILQYPKYEMRSADVVPVSVKELLQAPIEEFKLFDFKQCGYLQDKPMQKLDLPTVWEYLLYDESLQTFAIVAIRYPVESVPLFDIAFYTVFTDDSLLVTMNCQAYGVLDAPPNAIIQDAYTESVSVQWQLHQDRLKQLTATQTPCSLTPEAFLITLETSIAHYFDYLLKSKKLLFAKESESFQYTWSTALQKTYRTARNAKKVTAILNKRREQAQTQASISEETAIAMEVETFQRMEYLQQGLLSKKARTWLLLVSFGWFVASYAKIFSPETLAIFIVALLLHEGGHLLAMKLFGYRDTAILFLPFLGALATARQKHDATLTQKVWVSLAGPLPGLILGVGMAIATREGNHPDWLREAGWIFIGLNLFNLLPVYPLDGGQVADLLLFSRFPYLGVVFKVFGVICLGLLGINSPMMLAFTLLIALSIPNSFRTAKIHIKLSKELRKNPPIEPENLLQTIFSYLKQLGYDKLPYHQKSVLVKELMQRDRESRANWKTRVFLSAVYLGSLFGGVAGTFTAISPQWMDILSASFESPQQARDPRSAPVGNRVTKTKQEEIDRATEAIYINPNDVDAYLKRAQARLWFEDTKGAIADYNQVILLKPDDIQSRLNRASYLARLGDSRGALQDYDYILRLDPQNLYTYQSRALLYVILGDSKKALEDYDATIKLDSQDSFAYIYRGQIRQKLGDIKGALADANRAIVLDSEIPDAYILRSEIRRRIGDRKGAIADEQKADYLYENSEY